jgi:radical SAM superfamily enzyme YgiQ (UPF0313 family)
MPNEIKKEKGRNEKKIIIISPKQTSFYGTSQPWPQQNLTLIHLAALTPPEYEVEIVDENEAEVTYDKKPDIAGISFVSSTNTRAYEIADNYKKMGVPVILGGFHASLFPDEAQKHADAIVVGEAEPIWSELLSDFEKGDLKPIYKSNKLSDLKQLPIPRYDLYDPADYLNVFTIFVTRGCPYNCSYCSIKAVYGPSFRKRPIEEVVEQIQLVKNKYEDADLFPPLTFLFTDDNIWGDVKYAKELFRRLIPLNIVWYTQASVTTDEELLQLAAQSGCAYPIVGFESLNSNNLSYLNKKQNKPELYEECITKLHQAGMSAAAFFMVGLPYDDHDCLDELLKFLENNYVEFPLVFLYVPIPGTAQYDKKDWEGAHGDIIDLPSISRSLPVFTPQNKSKKEFKKLFVDFQRKLFSDESIERRLSKCSQPQLHYINGGMQTDYSSPEWDDWADE